MQKPKIETIIRALCLLAIFAFSGWWLVKWNTYPCEAFKTGVLSYGYAPGRCVK